MATTIRDFKLVTNYMLILKFQKNPIQKDHKYQVILNISLHIDVMANKKYYSIVTVKSYI